MQIAETNGTCNKVGVLTVHVSRHSICHFPHSPFFYAFHPEFGIIPCLLSIFVLISLEIPKIFFSFLFLLYLCKHQDLPFKHMMVEGTCDKMAPKRDMKPGRQCRANLKQLYTVTSQVTRPTSNSLSHGCPKIKHLSKKHSYSSPKIELL